MNPEMTPELLFRSNEFDIMTTNGRKRGHEESREEQIEGTKETKTSKKQFREYDWDTDDVLFGVDMNMMGDFGFTEGWSHDMMYGVQDPFHYIMPSQSETQMIVEEEEEYDDLFICCEGDSDAFNGEYYFNTNDENDNDFRGEKEEEVESDSHEKDALFLESLRKMDFHKEWELVRIISTTQMMVRSKSNSSKTSENQDQQFILTLQRNYEENYGRGVMCHHELLVAMGCAVHGEKRLVCVNAIPRKNFNTGRVALCIHTGGAGAGADVDGKRGYDKVRAGESHVYLLEKKIKTRFCPNRFSEISDNQFLCLMSNGLFKLTPDSKCVVTVTGQLSSIFEKNEYCLQNRNCQRSYQSVWATYFNRVKNDLAGHCWRMNDILSRYGMSRGVDLFSRHRHIASILQFEFSRTKFMGK